MNYSIFQSYKSVNQATVSYIIKKVENYKSTLVPIAIKDESVKREIPFLVACIPFTVFGTQFAQISTNVLPIRVWLMKIVPMDWTCILVPALLVLLGLRAQVSYQVKADYIQTPITWSNCSFSSRYNVCYASYQHQIQLTFCISTQSTVESHNVNLVFQAFLVDFQRHPDVQTSWIILSSNLTKVWIKLQCRT